MHPPGDGEREGNLPLQEFPLPSYLLSPPKEGTGDFRNGVRDSHQSNTTALPLSLIPLDEVDPGIWRIEDPGHSHPGPSTVAEEEQRPYPEDELLHLFPACVDRVDELARLFDELVAASTDADTVILGIRLSEMEGGVPRNARSFRRLWRRWSSRMSAATRRSLDLHVEVLIGQSHLLGLPGVLGSPSRFGDVGDDHWRICDWVDRATTPGMTAERMVLRLRSLPRTRSDSLMEIREPGVHLAAYPTGSAEHGFRCCVIGVLRREGLRPWKQGWEVQPLSWSPSRRHANPATAIAHAVSMALPACPPDLPLVVWTNQRLLADFIAHKVRVDTPDMLRACRRLRKAAGSHPSVVEFRMARRDGARHRELRAVHRALGAVRLQSYSVSASDTSSTSAPLGRSSS